MTVLLRPARSADCEQFFAWVNSPDSLASKLLTAGPIAWSDHQAWFARRLGDPGTTMWVVMDDGAAAGQLRLQGDDEGLEVDIFISPGARRSGLATQALELAAREIARSRPSARRLVAKVKPENQASLALFQSAGFACTGRQDSHLTFEYALPSALET